MTVGCVKVSRVIRSPFEQKVLWKWLCASGLANTFDAFCLCARLVKGIYDVVTFVVILLFRK